MITVKKLLFLATKTCVPAFVAGTMTAVFIFY